MPDGPPLTARNGSAIDELERIAAGHWRGGEHAALGDWILRAGGGFTGRANSALAIGDPGLPLDEALATVTDWYRARDLPPMVAVPLPLSAGSHLNDLLAERRWPIRPGPAYVMTAAVAEPAGPLSLPEGTRLHMDAEPDDAWLGLYHYRGSGTLPPVARQILASAPWQAFASIRDTAGSPAAIARLSVGGGWAGITAVEVAAGQRRRGLATLITQAVRAQAARQGAGQVFLQVETTNSGARALYERCGFGYSHWYQYRIAP
ncbi:MAG TPA: GNAT family N-acetyltransferase [Trebonia sp.]|nr:GNAT family N-acetyltransferase [Trebonia sp.]